MKENNWLLEVIQDLKAFASKNGMSQAAAILDDALWVAFEEIDEKERNTGSSRTGTQAPDSLGPFIH